MKSWRYCPSRCLWMTRQDVRIPEMPLGSAPTLYTNPIFCSRTVANPSTQKRNDLSLPGTAHTPNGFHSCPNSFPSDLLDVMTITSVYYVDHHHPEMKARNEKPLFGEMGETTNHV